MEERRWMSAAMARYMGTDGVAKWAEVNQEDVCLYYEGDTFDGGVCVDAIFTAWEQKYYHRGMGTGHTVLRYIDRECVQELHRNAKASL